MLNFRLDKLSIPIQYICLILVLNSCKGGQTAKDDGDIVLAQYKSNKLYFSEVKDIFQNKEINIDSSQLLQAYIGRWIKDKILCEKAKAELDDVGTINQLVEEYRNELLIMEYEKKLVKDKLDTLVSSDELLSYFLSNKSDYKLENTILRCIFTKVNKPIPDKGQFEQWWKTLSVNDIQMLNIYCNNNAEVCLINPEKWYYWRDISKWIPSKFLTEEVLKSGLSREFADYNYQYNLKIFEVVKPQQEPPLSFIKERATKAILHQRKTKLLEQLSREFYEKELKANLIKINLN